MVKENLKMDKLLLVKPTAADLFYPAMPSFKEARPNESEESRKRDIRNQRKINWENECKSIEFRGPFLDCYPCDKADTKIKSLVYLSNGTEASRIYHQNNPNTKIDTCTTYEFAHELTITFTKPRNTTYDCFLNARKESHEKLETFYSRLRELGAKAALGAVEEDLVKDFFIGKMNSTAMQMEILSEVRTPAQALNFALARKGGQQNQKEILRGTNSHWNMTVAHLSSRKTKPALLHTPSEKLSTMLEVRWILHTQPQQLSSQDISVQNLQKTMTLRKNVLITNSPTTETKRRIHKDNQQARNVKNKRIRNSRNRTHPLEEEDNTESIDPESTM